MRKKTLFIGAATCCAMIFLSELTVNAQTETKDKEDENLTQYQTCFDVEEVSFIETANYYYISDAETHQLIFYADKVDAEEGPRYTTTRVNKRAVPTTNSEPIEVFEQNAEINRIATSECGWDIAQDEEGLYFIWSEYLSTEKTKEKSNSNTYLGCFKLTAYCGCRRCNGKWTGQPTSSGTTPTAGRTVACNSIKSGTRIVINGHIYTVEDTGNMSSSTIDIYMDDHDSAKKFGVKYADVYLAE